MDSQHAVHTPSNAFSAMEYFDRLKHEYEYLSSQQNMNKIELERLKTEKEEVLHQSKKHFELAYMLNVKSHVQEEVNKRLIALLDHAVTNIIPEEHRNEVRRKVEEAQNVSMEDIERKIQSTSSEASVAASSDAAPLHQDPFATKLSIGGAPLQIPHDQSIQSSTQQQQQQQPQPQSVVPGGAPSKPLQQRNDNANHSTVVNAGIGRDSRNALVPRQMRQRLVFHHEHSVSYLTFNNSGERLYTGGKGCVNVWDTTAKVSPTKPKSLISCLNNAYIRSCKLTHDEQSMVVCGETKDIVVLDMNQSAPTVKRRMETNVDFHYALALTQDSKYCFSCFSDGNVGMWDLDSGQLVRKFIGHTDSVSCVDLADDGRTLVTGSLDSTMRMWDWNSGKEISKVLFPSRIYTLGICPSKSKTIAVGLENSYVEVLGMDQSPNTSYRLNLHESCVLSLNYSPNGDWFVTGGRDKFVNVWKSPFGPGIVRTKEQNSVLSVDVSPTNTLIATGSWDKTATIYECLY